MLWLLGWAAVAPYERARLGRLEPTFRGGDTDPRLTRRYRTINVAPCDLPTLGCFKNNLGGSGTKTFNTIAREVTRAACPAH